MANEGARNKLQAKTTDRKEFLGNVPDSINYPKLTMWQLVYQTADKYPDIVALEFMGQKIRYAQFKQMIEQVARALWAQGIRQGDKVTIAMPNCPQAVAMFYALNRVGALANMVHPLSSSGEYKFFLNFSKSKMILTIDQFYPKVAEIRESLDNPVKVLITRISDAFPFPLNIGVHLAAERKNPKIPADADVIYWKSFMRGAGAVSEVPVPTVTCYDAAAILYSGGTTGTMKGILLSSMNFNALGLQTAYASGIEFDQLADKKMLSIMPMFHGFGLGIGIHMFLIIGGTCMLVPRFSVKTYANLLRKKQPNFIAGVPTLYEALMRADNVDGLDLSCLMGVFSGGDCLSFELKQKVDAFLMAHGAKVQVREGYGTTECVTASCLTPKDYYRKGSIGLPFPDTFYKIVAVGTTDEVPFGQEGEICLTGPTVMIGYMDNPKETAMALKKHADGRVWLHTGDLGIMDEDGFVYFRQRIKRMIITSGYNVYPSQIENVIDGFDKVLYSCVIGVKDPYKVQKVKAFVVLKPGVEPSDAVKEELMAWCRKQIAKYAMPYDIEFRSELPKTLVGKVAYRTLEEEENQMAS